MSRSTRRAFLGAAGAAASAALLQPIRTLAETVKPVRIREIDSFRLDIPVSKEELAISKTIGYGPNDWHRSALGVVKVVTDVNVTGYSFYAAFPPEALPQIRQALVGKDLFAIEQHLSHGLNRWAGVEHAIWDAIGKIADQPVYKLLGGTKTSVKAYVTCVWKQPLTEVRYKEQAAAALKYKRAGFKGMKVQAWRPSPIDDADACREMRAAAGPDFAVMFDRTANLPESIGQKVWDYETGLKMARHSRNITPPGSKSHSHATIIAQTPAWPRQWKFPSPAAKPTSRWNLSGNVCSKRATIFCNPTQTTPAESSCAGKSLPWPKPSNCPAFCTGSWLWVWRPASKLTWRLGPSGRNWRT